VHFKPAATCSGQVRTGQPSQAKLRQTKPGQDEENDNKYFVAFAARLQCSMGVFRGVAKGGPQVETLPAIKCPEMPTVFGSTKGGGYKGGQCWHCSS